MSINANELRPNNWILGEEIHLYNQNIHSNGFTRITAYGIYMLSEHPELAEKYNPIPLTEQILTACGFSLQPQRISIWIKGRVKLWLGHNGVIAYLKHKDKDESFFIPHNPQYLHQLQNLYFSLTNEELPINQSKLLNG